MILFFSLPYMVTKNLITGLRLARDGDASRLNPKWQLWGMTDRPGGGDSDFFSSR